MKDKVKSLIGENKLKEAIDLLLSHYKGSDNENVVLIIKSKLVELNKKENIGVIDNDQSNLERNKIRHSILNIVDEEILSKEKQDTEAKEISPNEWSKTPSKSFWNRFKNIFEDKS